ncbi:enoyl-CoA hydratase/isomerase family protein [candidate division KSB1 bacterium]
MNLKTIKWQIQNNLGYLSLATPPKNEMNTTFFKEFSHLIHEIKDNNSISGLIIHAEGRHFSSGANIDQLLSLFDQSDGEILEPIIRNRIAFQVLSDLPFPVVACIKGICFGSALELALCAHFRIAAPNALLCLPETSFNIIPGLAGIYHTQQCMGSAKTLQFVLSGDTISANNALKNGLIDIFADKNDLVAYAAEFINYKKELKLKNYLRLFKKQNAS